MFFAAEGHAEEFPRYDLAPLMSFASSPRVLLTFGNILRPAGTPHKIQLSMIKIC